MRQAWVRAGAVALAALSIHASAQTRVVGVLLPSQPPPEYPAFTQQLAKLGWQEGRSLKLVMRQAGGDLERLPALAEELVKLKPEVLVSVFTPSTRAAMKATAEIPIVGFFGEAGRPGGNITGVTNLCGEMTGRRVTLLLEAIPEARRIAVFLNAKDPISRPQVDELKRIAPRMALEARFYPLKSPDDLPPAFQDALKWRAEAGLWLCGQGAPFMKRTVELALKHRLPVMVNQRQDVEAGGLISYFADHHERFRALALYVDRILKGAKPAELPIDQPLKFELAVNLKTASSIGVAIPQPVLARANVVVK